MTPARSTPAALALMTLMSLCTASAQAAKPRYEIIDLGVVGKATASQAFGVSPDGTTVVGRDLGDTRFPAFAWTASTGSLALPNLPGRHYAAANGVNKAGVIVGTSTTTVFGSGALPVMWVDGAIARFKLPPGQNVGRANAINAANLAVGSIGSDTGERGALYTRKSTKVIQATTANGSYLAYAIGINDAGLVVGSGIDPHNAAVNVGLVYDSTAGTLTSVGALPGDNGALAFGISNAGHVVGASMLNQGPGRPFIWTPAGGMVAIPLPPKTSQGSAYGVNAQGWAVGNGGGLYSVAFLYARGKTYALQSLLPPDSGWNLNKNTSSSAQAITDQGTIIGTGEHDGQTHAYAMVLLQANEAGQP